MPKIAATLLILLNIFSLSALAQSDIISVRNRKGRVVNQFTSGLPITYVKYDGAIVFGKIFKVDSDSVYSRRYEIIHYLNKDGINHTDTLAEHINITHYKDIQNIKVYEWQKPVLNKIDKILMWGG